MILLQILMKKYLRYLLALVLASSLTACSSEDVGVAFGNLNLSWLAPDQREDGSMFEPSLDLAEYRVYYGRKPGDYQNLVNVDGFTEVSVVRVPIGLYYAVVSAVDKQGREGLYSTEVEVLVTVL